MSDEADRDGFLSRWARRKASAKDDSAALKPDAEAPDATAPVEDGEPGEAEERFDLSKLPSLEEINAETSLTDFLRKDVPEALRNAAMKRAWALDPAIRDYVNPAMEYAFDWNAPGGVPGNGPLQAGFDAAKAVAQMFTKLPGEVVEAEAAPSGANTLGEGGVLREAIVQDAAPAANQPAELEAVRQSSTEPVSADKNSKDTPMISDVRGEEPPRTVAADPANMSARRTRHGGAAPV